MTARWTPLALILTLAACELDPNAADARTYHDAMLPLLVDNAEVARDFRDLAAKIKKEDTDARTIARMMRKTYIPAAEDLADRVEAVQPTNPTLQQAHAELVTAWSDRLTAYEDIHAAWKTQNLEAMNRATDDNLQAKRHEERYFDLIGPALAPYSLSLPLYPAQATAP